MHTTKRILELVDEKLGEAEALLELVCRRNKNCTTCPLRDCVPSAKGLAFPGDYKEPCLYHVLSSQGNGWNYGYKACHSCAHIHEGSCTLHETRGDDGVVDECAACEDYEEMAQEEE